MDGSTAFTEVGEHVSLAWKMTLLVAIHCANVAEREIAKMKTNQQTYLKTSYGIDQILLVTHGRRRIKRKVRIVEKTKQQNNIPPRQTETTNNRTQK